MKSDICPLDGGRAALERLLAETEKAAAYTNLGERESGRLRLLAEEMVEMLPELLSVGSGVFWVESEGRAFELHASIVPDERLTADLRERLLSVSSTGRNAAATGILSKIRLAAEFMLIDYEQNAADLPPFYAHGITTPLPMDGTEWSLQRYRESADEKRGEPWDELERSIVANLADDVLVGLSGRRVEITVKKSF